VAIGTEIFKNVLVNRINLGSAAAVSIKLFFFIVQGWFISLSL
jgi:hypothetical protein